MHTTSPTLLERLRQPDEHNAWEKFVNLYAPLVLGWLHRAGYQDADAADIAQETLVKLVGLLPTYHRGEGQSFRGWLHRVTVNLGRDFHRRRANRPLPTGHGAFEADIPADEGSDPDLGEYRRALVARGLALIRPDFSASTWAAFEGQMIHGRPAEEVAVATGLSVNAAYLARHRVLARLRQELDGLLD